MSTPPSRVDAHIHKRNPLKLTALATAAFVAIAGQAIVVPAAMADETTTIAGGQSSGDSLFPNVGNTGYDVSHYDIEIAWATSQAISATTTITAKVDAGYALSTFSLDFEGLTIDSLEVNGQPASYERIIDAASTKYKLIVTPTTPVTGEFTTVISYSGTPTKHTDPDESYEGWYATSHGATAVNEPVGAMTWYPVNNSLLDKATYNIDLTVPTTIAGYTAAAVSNGELLSRTPDEGSGTTTWKWQETNQMEPYLSMVSIGPYDIYESDIYLETTDRTIKDWSFIDPTLSTSRKTTAIASKNRTPEILNWMEQHYGRYPGNSTGIVVDSLNLGYALETQDRPVYSNSASLSTHIHELVHQWFGDSVSPTDWSDIWLNEGPADYITAEANFGLGITNATPENSFYSAWNLTSATSSSWLVPVAGFDDPAGLFDWQTYTRASWTLENLRSRVGDATFSTIMNTWLTRYAGTNASTADYIALVKEISGNTDDVEAFFQEWLYLLGKPAWPATWTYGVTSDTADGTVLKRGDLVTVTLSAANVGKVALDGKEVTLDLSSLLPYATIDLGANADVLTLDGSVLTWTVPSTALAQAAETSFTATVSDTASGGAFGLAAHAAGLGVTNTGSAYTYSTEKYSVSPSGIPTIAGTAKVGSTLSVQPGEWDPTATLSYQWKANGASIAGATGSTLVVTPTLKGKSVTVTVTGAKDGYTSVSTTSASVTVAAGTLTHKPTPVISGKAKVGSKLTVKLGTLDPGVKVTYQWKAKGKSISGATGKTLKLTKGLKGKKITVTVKITKAGYTTVKKTSRGTRAVAR